MLANDLCLMNSRSLPPVPPAVTEHLGLVSAQGRAGTRSRPQRGRVRRPLG